MKKLLLGLLLPLALFGADAANDIVLQQRNSGNTGFIQRNLAPTANAALGVNTNKVPVALTAFTQDSVTGAAAVTAGGTNQNITLTPSGTGVVTTSKNITLTSGTGLISTGTSDGADNAFIQVAGGGSGDTIRGAYFTLVGNEYATASAQGVIEFVAGTDSGGNASAGSHRWSTGGSTRMFLWKSGGLQIATSPAADPGAANVLIGTATSATYNRLVVGGGVSTLPDTSSKLQLGRYSSGAPSSYLKLGTTATALKITNAADTADIFSLADSSGACAITGGAGNMTITAGTGASRTLTFQTTTSGSTATDAATFAADQSLRFPSTNTAGLQLYNTADQTTNYERLEMLWSSNAALFGVRTGASGTGRNLYLISQTSSGSGAYSQVALAGASFGVFRQGLFTLPAGNTNVSNSGTGTAIQFSGAGTYTATSGTIINFAITPTYNQASGTAANTDSLVNRTETAIGSGRQMLHDWQIGGNSIAGISRVGSVLYANTNTSQGEATSAVRKLRSVTDIADNTATDVFTVTIPNAAHSATIRVTFSGSLGAGGAIGANEATGSISYDFSVARTAGVNAVVGASSAYGSSTAAVAGAATITITGAASAISGAVGATNTFTIQVTIARGSGSSTNHTCRATAEVINQNATGITIS